MRPKKSEEKINKYVKKKIKKIKNAEEVSKD